MLIFTKEYLICVFEDELDLNSNGKHNHWHQESYEHLFLLRELGFIVRKNLCYRYEQLFGMVFVKWQWINVPKHTPVSQMTDLANQLGRLFISDGILGY
jgi:hypothetical protein